MDASFCLTCELKKNCEKICPELEKRLNRRDIAGYTARHKRRKEVLFPTNKLERVASKRAFELKYGKKYERNYLAED